MSQLLKNIRYSWPFAVLGLFYLYLTYHALSGNQGIFKWVNYQDEITMLETQIADLKAERNELRIHADQLRASQLDLDRLDIEARTSLNVSYANEIVIWLDEN